MSIITQFRLCPDHRSRAVELFGQIVDALHQCPPFSEDQIVIWEGLERIVQRFIGSAQAVEHPIGVHSPDFWEQWHRFVDRNARLGRARRRNVDETSGNKSASAAPLQTPHHPFDTVGGFAEAARAFPLTPGELARMRIRPALENGTRITSLTTIWGVDDAAVLYDDGSAGSLDGDHGPVAARLDPRTCTDLDETTSPDLRRHAEGPSPKDALTTATGRTTEDATSFRDSIKERLDALAIKLGNRRADESHGRVLQFALDFFGDLRLVDLDKKRLRALELALAEIPMRKGVPRLASGSLHERYLYARACGWESLERISKTTLKNTYFGTMNSFLAWAGEKYEWSAPDFRFDQEVAEAPDAEDRDAFSNDELIRFFRLPLFTGCLSATHIWKVGEVFVQNAHYWGYLIHFFMGLRPSEIGQLLVDDIIDQDGMHWIDLRDDKTGPKGKKRLKSKAARRLVPIPRLLVDLGLAERAKTLKKRGERRLFPDWTVYEHPQSGRKMYGHFLSKSWQYVKESQGFKRKNLSLYSGRHTLAGWYDAMRLPDRIRMRLLGHAPSQVAHGYGPQSLNEDEARVAVSEELKIQVDIVDILLTAKLKADYGTLMHAG